MGHSHEVGYWSHQLAVGRWEGESWNFPGLVIVWSRDSLCCASRKIWSYLFTRHSMSSNDHVLIHQTHSWWRWMVSTFRLMQVTCQPVKCVTQTFLAFHESKRNPLDHVALELQSDHLQSLPYKPQFHQVPALNCSVGSHPVHGTSLAGESKYMNSPDYILQFLLNAFRYLD